LSPPRDEPAIPIAQLLERARALASTARDAAAREAYLDLLRRCPTHFAALNELGTLAHASGHRSAARTAYEQAVRHHPKNSIARVNLGNLLYEDGDLAAACAQYEAALAVEAGMAQAHQGLARVFADLGDAETANEHLHRGFAGRAIVTQLYRGSTPGAPVLLLVSAKGGNIPTRPFLDDRVFAVTALYAEFYDPRQPLPPHSLVLNAIGDAELCATALERAEDVLAHTTAPVINAPARVRMTGRIANAWRLANVPGVVAPATRLITRSRILGDEGLTFPFLLRTPGFHTGQHLLRVLRPEDLQAAVAQLPGDELLAIDYLDARGADGRFHKYRVMVIDGVLYPLHLAVSSDWKVHYFTADGAGSAAHREDEKCFLEDIAAVVGPRAMSALTDIDRILGLDYGGIDFGLGPDGSVLFFEANATMVINPPDANPIWDYRRGSIDRALDAAKRMVLARAKA